jgi:hypothetical protein
MGGSKVEIEEVERSKLSGKSDFDVEVVEIIETMGTKPSAKSPRSSKTLDNLSNHVIKRNFQKCPIQPKSSIYIVLNAEFFDQRHRNRNSTHRFTIQQHA